MPSDCIRSNTISLNLVNSAVSNLAATASAECLMIVSNAGLLVLISPRVNRPSMTASPLTNKLGDHTGPSNATALSMTVICTRVDRSSIPTLPNCLMIPPCM